MNKNGIILFCSYDKKDVISIPNCTYLLAFRLLNLYRTRVRRRDLKGEISLRFSVSA